MALRHHLNLVPPGRLVFGGTEQQSKSKEKERSPLLSGCDAVKIAASNAKHLKRLGWMRASLSAAGAS